MIPVAPFAGVGEPGALGGAGAAAVAKDHTGPAVEPAALLATICQK